MKKIKILVMILAIILITMVSFFGVYTKFQNRMVDNVKKYSYAMDLKGYRSVKLKIKEDETKTVIKDTEGNEVKDADNLTDEELQEKGYVKEEVPSDNGEKTLENYKKVKEIIEKRLKRAKVEDYIIRLNEENGDIIIQIPEDDNTDSVVANIYTVGKFEIVDKDTDEVLMTNDDIKTSKVIYGSSSSTTTAGTAVYLTIEFDKEGTKKFEDITSKYVEIEENEESEDTEEVEETNNASEENNVEESENDTTSETTDTEDNETTESQEKQITMKVDDQEIISTSFDKPIETGTLQLSVGTATTDVETLNGYIEQASNMANVLDTGNLPLEYEVDENEYIVSNIKEENIQKIAYVALGILAIALIVLIIRYKLLGLLSSFSFIGLTSLFLLLIRYGNVKLSLNGIFGIGIVLVLNYIFVNKLLSKIKNSEEKDELEKVNKASKETYKEFFIRTIPILIITIVFALIKWATISSFGMVMFWGILLITIYNLIITNGLIKIYISKNR